VNNPLDEERLQFYLRHRDDIREWASIEREVILATRELLAASQTELEERLVGIDPGATTSRRDGSRYERIVAHRAGWPQGVGVTLEWETGVDPFGSVLPKYGIFLLNDEPSFQPARVRIAALVESTAGITANGFGVSNGKVWPAVKSVPKSTDWWQDPAAWTGRIVDAMIELWPLAAVQFDRGLIEAG